MIWPILTVISLAGAGPGSGRELGCALLGRSAIGRLSVTVGCSEGGVVGGAACAANVLPDPIATAKRNAKFEMGKLEVCIVRSISEGPGGPN